MFREYAVDPSVIASSFEICRYLISQFGADKGRLISKFPKSWKREAIDAANELPDGLGKERVVEYLAGIGNEWLTLIGSNRAYELPGDSWLNNALAAHRKAPFHAVVCDRDDMPVRLINAGTCDERNPLFTSRINRPVNRTANDLSQAALLLLQNCRKLRLVDPHFDPNNRERWLSSLAAFLSLIPDISRVECEYHLQEKVATPHKRGSPSTEELVRRLEKLKGIIPAGGTLRIVRWKEITGGERLHGRYVLSDTAGLNYEGGLDVATDATQTTDVSLLDRETHRQRWDAYNLDSQVYELYQPVLVVDWEGIVT